MKLQMPNCNRMKQIKFYRKRMIFFEKLVYNSDIEKYPSSIFRNYCPEKVVKNIVLFGFN